MKLQIATEALEAVGRAIFITGSTRAGTTMMGRLIHSLDKVEHINEPAQIFALLSLIDEIPAELWRVLYASFLFEDHLLPALAGRHLNLNEHDDSSVFKAKDRAEVLARYAKTHRRQQLLPASRSARCSFKVPEMIPAVPSLKARFPHTCTIIMVRQPTGVIASILEKKWYSGSSIDLLNADVFHQERHGWIYPYWLPEEYFSAWQGFSELERACFSYMWQYEQVAQCPEDCLFIDYDAFVQDVERQFTALVARIGCSFGRLTPQLLREVKEPEKSRDIPLGSLSPELRRRLEEAHELAKSRVTPL